MDRQTESPSRSALVIAIVATCLWTIPFSFAPPITIVPIEIGDSLFLVFVALHISWAASLLVGGRHRPMDLSALRRTAETFFFYGLFLFLFAYIFARNAGLDYVQRFVESGGNLQLAPDTRTERLIAIGRYGPLLVLDAVLWSAAVRGSHRRLIPKSGSAERTVPPGVLHVGLSPLLTLVAVALSVSAVPSFVRLDGVPILGWVNLVPLMIVLRSETDLGNYGRAVWYGILYGVLFTLLGNFWLGTFSLVSLQAVGIIFLLFYGAFMPLAVLGLAVVSHRVLKVLIVPLAWTAFELARSSGFLGYPWLLVAHSQYRNTALIQWSEVGGVWLVSFIVLLVNSLIAEMMYGGLTRRSVPAGPSGGDVWRARWYRPGIAALIVLIVAHAGGAALPARGFPSSEPVRVALVQQNSDPRRHRYEETFDSLRELTNRALEHDPDLIAWSETAFVPNIRRWSREDPERYRLARLVREFIRYQESIDTWLVTGNDDYRRVLDADGREIARNSFNAAVLFSDTGERRNTYHKIRLVPFTEYFPYERQLPWIYNMLREFDVTFWTPGSRRTIFEHPKMRFATPICFEDVFPGDVRKFARAGMEVIVNLTNDYWSLEEVAAQQHFVAALFRTVELRRPMVRATASGVTAHVDARGEIVATVPQYSEQILTADVRVPAPGETGHGPATLYYRWGDWVPWSSAALWGVLVLGSVIFRLSGRPGRLARAHAHRGN